MSDQGTPTSPSTQASTATSTDSKSSTIPADTGSDISTEELGTLAGDDIDAAVKEASKPKDQKKAEAAAKRKYKLKVDGEEDEWEGTDDDIKKELQLAKKARKEIQTASELKKEIAQFLKLLKENPKAALSDPAVGLDVKQFAQQIINEQIEEELKSPEAKERERLEKELEELRKRTKDDEERRQKEEYERMVAKHEAELEDKIQEALETSGLPKSPYVLKRLADVMLSAFQGNKDISPKQAMNIVKREMNKDMKEFFTASPEELIEEFIGQDVLKKLNKRQLAKIKAAAVTANTIKDTGSKPQQTEETSKQTQKVKMKDFLKRF